jgi:phosphoribosylglycinamide formyltransferase
MAAAPPTPTPSPPRITVLISGNGTNLQALIDAQPATTHTPQRYTITQVVSNRRNARGLARAAAAGIPTAYHNLLPYRARFAGDEAAARAAYDADLAALVLRGSRSTDDHHHHPPNDHAVPALVVCAGFMHVLGRTFLDSLRERAVPVINLHPGELRSPRARWKALLIGVPFLGVGSVAWRV